MTIFEETRVHGAGGGGGKGGGGGGGSAPTEDPNTLQSKSTARLIDLLGEGEIGGLVDGAKSIHFNDTPLLSSDGGENFKGVTWEQRTGLPDQAHVPGFPATETEIGVNAEVLASQPVTRTVTDPSVDAVRVTVSVNALTSQDTSTGDLHGARVEIAIDVRSNGGAWTTTVSDAIDGKTVSTYERAYRVDLDGNGPWDIRVRRITPDSDKATLQNKTYFSRYAEIIDGKFTYPDSALVAITIDAQQFGGQIPTRSYDVKGLLIRVPSNYDPETRGYTGLWDGTFKRAWTDNPAWVFYDILTNERYGLGDAIAATQVDKWSLYGIARYCDGMVPSGRKDGSGKPILEPRYTFNGAITGREEAYRVVQGIASVFRGMAFWSAGSVFARADMPSDPVKLVTPANVVGGDFTYNGTALKARHSVALVQWNDPEDGYKTAIEVVEDHGAIAQWGWRPVEITAFGCCRRSQARRMGLWVLDSERHETETVTYSASFDHADLTPGDLIAIADPSYANARFGGRLAGYGETGQVTLDAPVEIESGQTYSFSVMLPDGTIATRGIVYPGNPAAYDRLQLDAPLSPAPAPNAMWVLTASNLSPRLFRVRAVRETEKNVFEITALFHDPTKYARIEDGLTLAEPTYTRPSNDVPDPGNVTGHETRYLRNDVPRSRVSLSWTAPAYPYLTGYRLSVTAPSGVTETVNTTATSYDVVDAEIGVYRVTLRTVAWNGSMSPGAPVTVTTTGWEDVAGLYVSHLEVDGRGTDTTFTTADPVFTWRGNFPDTSWEPASEPAAGAGRVDPRFRDYVVRIYDEATKTLLRTEYTTTPRFQYFLQMNRADSARLGSTAARRRIRIVVSIRDTLWRESKAATLDVYNPPLPEPQDLSVNGAVGAIHVTFALPDASDFAGTCIWRGDKPGFPTDRSHLVAEGRDSAYVIPADPNLGYYVRVAHHDSFGGDEANLSPEIFVSPAFVVDTEPPPRPDAPVLATAMGGDGRPRLTAAWQVSEAADFAGFELAIKPSAEDASQWQFVTTTETAYTWTVDPNVSYDVRLRAFDTSSNRSAYSDTATLVSARDETPPGPVTGLSADASFRSVWLSWQNPADADYAYAEVWEGTSEDRGAATRLGTQPGAPSAQSVMARSGLEPGSRRCYWVRPFDTSGNGGAWTGPAGTTTASLQLPDFPPDFGPVPFGTTLPPGGPTGSVTLFLKMPEQVLHRWNGTAWEPAIDLSEVSGAITATQITDGAITTPKLSAGAITADKIATNAVTAGKIAANAVTAGTIQAGAITADKIAANAVITSRAQIGDAVIDSAHIRDLDASKIRAGTVLSGGVIVDGRSLSSLASETGDPVARINSGSTRIDPGKITIAGSTTLGDWRSGPNQTQINGGAIAANTITANKLSIGTRGVIVGGGLDFEANKNNGTVSWTAGNIQYMDENGSPVKVEISGGASSGVGHIYWVRGNGTLSFAPDFAASIGNDRIRLASYYGGSNLVVHYGGTVIDGSRITTGSIQADQIAARAIKGDHIEGNTITGNHLRTNAINTQHITAGSVERDRLALKVIGPAQIEDLAVETLKIGQHAVTIPVTQTDTDTRVGAGGWQIVTWLDYRLPFDGLITILFSALHSYRVTLNVGHILEIRINGNPLVYRGGDLPNDYPSIMGSAWLGAGTYRIEIAWRTYGYSAWRGLSYETGSNDHLLMINRTISILGSMR